MKSAELKKMIKDSVKEAIQEELKDILLEAVKSPRTSNVGMVQESSTPQPPQPTSNITAEQKRSLYEQALGETSLSFQSQDAQSFKPQAGYDPSNGTLPQGNVGMDQIMSLIGTK